jgi:hypothetical protein
MPPGHVLTVDHTDGAFGYLTRAGSVKKADPGKCTGPCRMVDGKLFCTDDGKGGAAWLLCCDDYQRQTLLVGTLADALKRAAEKGKLLAAGSRAAAYPCCAKCDRHGGTPTGFESYPPLTAKPCWPPPFAEKVAGRRLVILPCNMKWSANALPLLATISRLATMEGQTLLFWNDRDKCPPELKLPGVIVWERDAYPGGRGWTAINRGIGEAMAYALAEGYDYVIKLDTDTAILRKGYDAAILAGADPDVPEMRGFLLEEKVHEWARSPITTNGGIFTAEIKALLDGPMRWARGHVAAGWHKGHHMQGGCWALTRAGMKQLAASPCGLVPTEAEHQIGEDILISLRARVANLKQTHVPAVVSHYFPTGSYDPSVIRYYRDCGRAAVIHPVKDANILAQLSKEAGSCG